MSTSIQGAKETALLNAVAFIKTEVRNLTMAAILHGEDELHDLLQALPGSPVGVSQYVFR
jgi:hypothetical protein